MTDSLVTQCPHCQTRFRVTGAQLGIAGGSVRCGACLLVFNAAHQLDAAAEDDAPDHALPATPVSHSQFGSTPLDVRPAAPASLSATGDYRPPLQVFRPAAGTLALDVPVIPPALTPVTSQPGAAAQPQTPPALLTSIPEAGEAAPAASADIVIDLDKINAELALMVDGHRPQPVRLPPRRRRTDSLSSPAIAPAAMDTDSPPATQAAAAQPDAPTPVIAAVTAAVTAPASAAVSPPLEQPAARADGRQRPVDEPPLHLDADEEHDDPPLGTLDEDDDIPARVAEKRPAHPAREAGKDAQRDDDDDDDGDEPLASGLSAAADDDDAPNPAGPVRLGPIHDTLINLNAEPLQLEWRQQPRSPWRALLWLLLCLLAGTGLAAQYGYFNFEHLARQPQWRPWFEQLCPQIGCQLPSRVDIVQIKSSNLTVRSHPSQTGALQVDAIIYNKAEFAQPFPLLELRFEDMNHLVLAQRSFRPAEYLGGELAGSKDMPPQTPIHIALEIVDPGIQATNYFLDFHSPE